MAKKIKENAYIVSAGYGVNSSSQNKPFLKWLVSKIPAAGGGLFAHEVYDIVTKKIFPDAASKYGADIVGSIGLAIVAWSLDHNAWPVGKTGFSDDLTQSFTDGMMGRGAPAVWNSTKSVFERLVETVTPSQAGAKKAQGFLSASGSGPSLDAAPEALADMMSLLCNSPRTRQMLADDLITSMEKRDMEVSPQARSNIANCIGDLAESYKR